MYNFKVLRLILHVNIINDVIDSVFNSAEYSQLACIGAIFAIKSDAENIFAVDGGPVGKVCYANRREVVVMI